MARKRMIDPEILDSALVKNWKPEDFTVMVAAISTADDEGRGLVSVLFRNVSSMISEKKFRKCLQKLDDSIIIYQKIYFFLPKFLKYQTFSHPKPSKFPKPNYEENKDLAPNSSAEIPPIFQNNSEKCRNASIPVKINVKEYSLKEVNVKEDNVDNSLNKSLPTNEPDLLFNNHSSFTFYQDCLPLDFADTDSVRNSITKLIAKFCNGTVPTKSEITRILNIVTGTRGAKPETCFKITAQTLSEFNSLPLEKKNFAYLSHRILGKINDTLTKEREEMAVKLKEDERRETELFNQKEVKSLVNGLTNKFKLK